MDSTRDSLDILQEMFEQNEQQYEHQQQQQYYMQQQPQEEVAAAASGKPKPKRGRTSGGGQQQATKPAPQQQQQQQQQQDDDDDAADVDAQMEQVIKEMQLFNLFKTPPPMHFVFLCKECRTAMFFDRKKVRLVGNDQTEMRTKMCALCRKGNMELRRIFAQYWPYRP